MDRSQLKKMMIFIFLFGITGLTYSQSASLPYAEKEAIFNAAGFKHANGAWRGKCSFGHITVLET